MEKNGKTGMVNISDKKITLRTAKAQATIKLGREILERIKKKTIAKGDVLEQSRIAGILAAKKTPELIPLCHPLRITDLKIEYELKTDSIIIQASAAAEEKTGVEMEALTAAMTTALNIYDMCKMYRRDLEITGLLLLEKTGGSSGPYRRNIK